MAFARIARFVQGHVPGREEMGESMLDDMLTRRRLLQGAAFVGASAFIVGAVTLPAPASAEDTQEAQDAPNAKGVQYGFLVDISKCVDCEKCVAACREANGIQEGQPDRRHIQHFTDSRGQDVTVSTSCMHCAEPSCLRVCPAGAIVKGYAGIVSVNKNDCIGCKYCYEACPYDVPRYTPEGMDKCDCCLGAGVAPGDVPNCVRACIFGALEYGPIEELKAKAPDAVLVAEINNPSCLIRNSISYASRG